MSRFIPIRDTAGRIVDMQPGETLFAQTLASTLRAVGGAEQASPAQPPRRASYRPGWLELAAILGGLALAAVLIGLLNTFWPAEAPRALAPTAAPALAAPTIAPAPTPTIATQDAYAAPDGALLGPVPLSAPIVYQHSAYSGWGGVVWQGSIVWVRTDRDLAGMVDLAPPPTVEPAIVEAAPAVELAEPSHGSKQTDEAGPHADRAAVQTCWEGPPRANPGHLPACWAGVPFVAP